MAAAQTRIVELHGFNQAEKTPFLSIFSLSRCRPIAYRERQVGDVADLRLLNTDEPSAVHQMQADRSAQLPLVLVGNTKPSDPATKWMTKPIRWVRLIELLDELTVPRTTNKVWTPSSGSFPSEYSAVSLVKPVIQPVARVLVVDDNLTVRQFMAQKLNPFSCEVDFAESGEQALEFARTNSYTCIFLDVVMDGIDGYQTCKILRQHSKRRNTSIYMLTSRGSSIDKIRGKMAGCTGYLTKPVDEERLLGILAQHLSTESVV